MVTSFESFHRHVANISKNCGLKKDGHSWRDVFKQVFFRFFSAECISIWIQISKHSVACGPTENRLWYMDNGLVLHC